MRDRRKKSSPTRQFLSAVFVASIASVMPMCGADAADDVHISTPITQQLVEALKPGLTRDDVRTSIRTNRPGNWSDSAHFGSGLMLPIISADIYPISDEENILVFYENGLLSKVQVTRFDELKSAVDSSLFSAVRLIHQSRFVGVDFDPVKLIRAVNALQLLGKEKALREYLHITRSNGNFNSDRYWRYNLDEQRIFLIARLLFVRKDGQRQMPHIAVVNLVDAAQQRGDEEWPLYPLCVIDDFPVAFGRGYELSGQAQSPEEHLKYFEANCELRSNPLKPSRSPFECVRQIESSTKWKKAFESRLQCNAVAVIRAQAVRSVYHLLPTPDRSFEYLANSLCNGEKEMDERWNQIESHFSGKTIEWDAEVQDFVVRQR